MNIKTILGVGALAATGMAFFGKNQLSGYKNVIKNLGIRINKVKEVTFDQNVNFKVDIMVANPTPTAVNVPGNLINIKKLHFYTLKGEKLAEAVTNISDIVLPANGTREITNIPVTSSLEQLGNNIGDILNIALDSNQLKIAAEIEAFGKSFIVNA